MHVYVYIRYIRYVIYIYIYIYILEKGIQTGERESQDSPSCLTMSNTRVQDVKFTLNTSNTKYNNQLVVQ